MSTRLFTQIKFNRMFKEYRKKLLPAAVTTIMSPREKEELSSVDAFFRGMHLVSGPHEAVKNCHKSLLKISQSSA